MSVTLYGSEDLELTDIFECLKVEQTAENEELVYQEGSSDEGITYMGMVEAGLHEEETNHEIDFSESKWHEVELSRNLKDEDGKEVDISGKVLWKTDLDLHAYILNDDISIALTTATTFQGSIGVGGSCKIDKSLAKLSLPTPIAGIFVEMDARLVFEGQGEVSVGFEQSKEDGFTYTSIEGFKEVSKPGELTIINIDIDAEVSIGAKVGIGISLLKTIEIMVCPETGVVLEGTLELVNVTEPTVAERHTCEKCLSADISLYAKITVELKLTLIPKWKLEWTPVGLKTYLGKWYYSFTYKTGDWGECPHKEYRITAYVVDDETPLIDREIFAAYPTGEYQIVGVTDGYGQDTFYLPNGSYTLEVVLGSGKICTRKIEVDGQAQEIWMVSTSGSSGEDGTGGSGTGSGTGGGTDGGGIIELDPDSVVASGECGKRGDNVTWVLNKQGILLISGNGAMADYTGLPPWGSNQYTVRRVIITEGVTTIGEGAFAVCQEMTDIKIPQTVTSIGKQAFFICSSLTSISLPESLRSIGTYAFNACHGLTSVTIPNGVTMIEDGTFRYCDNLRSVKLPESITKIGEGAFSECFSLESIAMPQSVVSIGKGAFSDCRSLTDVYLENVTSIGEGAFEGCGNLTSIVIPDGIKRIEDSTFRSCGKLTDVVLPQNLTEIGGNAFGECGSLRAIVIPEKVTSIGDHAFQFCNSLYAVTIPGSVKNIGYSAFHPCSNLTELELLQGVKSVGDYAFAESNLRTLTIPASLTSIGKEAFAYCHELTAIHVNDGNNMYSDRDGVLFNKSGTEILSFPAGRKAERYEVPAGVIAIGDLAFNWCLLTSVEIPEGVTSIGVDAFRNSKLTEIVIPASVTSIDEYAFFCCSNLANVYYGGNETQWDAISVAVGNDELTSATVYYKADDTTNSIFSSEAQIGSDGWQATFSGLVPNTDYAVIVSRASNSPLAAENLQYITQVTADANGNLTVYYRQSDPEAASCVVACGSGKTIVPSNPGVSSGGGSGDGGAAAALLLAGAGAVAAVVVARAVLPVEVSGIVTDETGAPLPGATVAFWQNGAVVQQTVTGETGGYSVKLKKGGYDLAVSYLDPATGTAFQQTVTITAPDKARTVALDLSALKVPAGQA